MNYIDKKIEIFMNQLSHYSVCLVPTMSINDSGFDCMCAGCLHTQMVRIEDLLVNSSTNTDSFSQLISYFGLFPKSFWNMYDVRRDLKAKMSYEIQGVLCVITIMKNDFDRCVVQIEDLIYKQTDPHELQILMNLILFFLVYLRDNSRIRLEEFIGRINESIGERKAILDEFKKLISDI